MESKDKPRVLLVSLAPPEEHTGVRIILHRHLRERAPFELCVLSNTVCVTNAPQPDIQVRLHPWLERVRRTRLHRWILDYENLVWPLLRHEEIFKKVKKFNPQVILTVADNNLSWLALNFSRRLKIPLAGLFLDWFPIMDQHYGHKVTQKILSKRFRNFYKHCHLALCTSEGMREELGIHPNCHIVYPIGGRHKVPEQPVEIVEGRLRVLYVGSVEKFYGRMLCSLLDELHGQSELELKVIGPNADWPTDKLQKAISHQQYLGFLAPADAAKEIVNADILLVVMSFEKEYELFMRTSFTTKFLDYVKFNKPVLIWGPEYCTPSKLANAENSAIVVSSPSAKIVLKKLLELKKDKSKMDFYREKSRVLSQTLFCSDRLQKVFVDEINKLISNGN
jgi:hypothetical protein